ncbi:MAG: efflux RND transporter periplasmic adaptor subunit [Crocinitomicaceae bacterium]
MIIKGKVILIIFASLLVFSCGKGENKGQKQNQSLQVESFEVNKGYYADQFTTTATLIANEEVDLKAPFSGQVLKISFEEGSPIKKGQSIIQLDDRVWNAQLSGLHAELEKSEKEQERKRKLLDSGGASEKDMDVLKATIEKLRAQIKELELNIELAKVKAPFSGVLGMRNFSEGAYLREGDIITKLSEIKKLKVSFSIPTDYKDNLVLGDSVKVVVQNDTIFAKIYAISPVINATTRTIEARAFFNQKKENPILPGTFGEVIIAKDKSSNALLVPSQAIVPEINDQIVYVYRNGKAERREVKIGGRNDQFVMVVNGIKEGDTIVTSGLLQIKNGMTLELQTIKRQNQ